MSPRQHVLKLLDRWEKSDAYADILLEKLFDQNKISTQDRALIQEIFFGVIRWRKRLDWIIEQFFQGSIKKSPRFVRQILQSSLYQLIYLDRIPSYAIINEAVKIAKFKGGRYWSGKINAILRNFLNNQNKLKFPDISKSPVEAIAIQYSFPRWIVERWIKRWGVNETIALCTANNKRPQITLRVNSSKIQPEKLEEKLSELNVQIVSSEHNENFFRADTLPPLSQLQLFQQGYFSIQDESAGLACQLLQPEPGETIVDLCAAPGGKTAYLNELSKNKANIYSIDLNFSRLKLIRESLKRPGFSTSRLIQGDARNFTCKPADKIIVDVPCSGLGVIAKRVDLRWRRKPEQIGELTKIQLDILRNAASLVKSGGSIVYSTCTIEPEENEEIITEFLNENKQFKIDSAKNYVPDVFTTNEGYVYTFPHKHGIDGSFAVRLKKR